MSRHVTSRLVGAIIGVALCTLGDHASAKCSISTAPYEGPISVVERSDFGTANSPLLTDEGWLYIHREDGNPVMYLVFEDKRIFRVPM